jgi:hypothetical protein
MAFKEPNINKQAAAVLTTDVALKIPETLNIIRNPGNATTHNSIMVSIRLGLLTNYGIKKHKIKIHK